MPGNRASALYQELLSNSDESDKELKTNDNRDDHLSKRMEELDEALVTIALRSYSDDFQAAVDNLAEKGQILRRPIVKESEHRFLRYFFFGTISSALLMEIPYLLVQIILSSDGLNFLTHNKKTSLVIAVILSLADFIVNISSVSPSNDTNALVFSAFQHPALQKYFKELSIIQVISCISYIAGGAGNVIGVLPFLMNHHVPFPLLVLFTIFAAIVGTAYYLAFNIKRTLSSLVRVMDYWDSSKTPKADNDYLRAFMIVEESLSVMVFRGLTFAGLGVLTLESLKMPLNQSEKVFLALVTLLATDVNIAMSRLIDVVDHWSNNDYAYLKPSELRETREKYSLGKYAKVLLSGETATSLCKYAGLVMISGWVEPFRSYMMVLAIGFFFVNCNAQINREIFKKTRERVGDNVINDRKPKVTTESNTAAETETDESVIKKAASHAFTVLMQPHLDDWKRKRMTQLCVLGSLAARGLSFLTFTNFIAELCGLKFNFIQVIGFACYFAPSNMRNMYSMFYGNMLENLATKRTQRDIIEVNSNGAAISSSWCSSWRGSISKQFQLYRKSTLEYTPEQLKKTVEAEIRKLTAAENTQANSVNDNSETDEEITFGNS